MLDPRTHEPTNPFLLYNGNGTTTTHRSYNSSWDEEVDSPPLWSTSPSRDHNRANHHHHYRSMSPASRTQAIVRGQRELMEMVKNMPESNYELSLKDLVEHHHRHNNNSEEAPTAAEDQRKTKSLKNGSGRGGGGSRRVVRRSGSIDRGSGGFYLKMVIPSFSLGSKKKNKNKNKNKNNESLVSANNSKVSPRPTTNNNNSDKEWWKKSDDSGSSSLNSGSSTKRSGSSSSSNSSCSTSNSRVRHEKSNGHRCWPCIPRRKRQTQK